MDARNCTRTISGGFAPRACRVCGPVAWAWLNHCVGWVLRTVSVWQKRRRYRAYLAIMDERDLRDIGLCRLDAEREANRPFWKRPEIDETSRGRVPRT